MHRARQRRAPRQPPAAPPRPPADAPPGARPPAADAEDLAAYGRRLPLGHLSDAFFDLQELDRLPLDQLAAAAAEATCPAPGALGGSWWQLPPEVRAAYCELRAALAAVVPPEQAALGSKHSGTGPGAAQNGAAPAPLPRLPWRQHGVGTGKRAAQHAADWLGQQLEAAEMQKALLRWGAAGG